MPIQVTTNYDHLIEPFRYAIGDTTLGNYRYLDEDLRTTLSAAIIALQRRWSRKYLINTTTYDAERNTIEWTYKYASPPVIQQYDEEPILVMAQIILLEGSLENLSWNLGSWRDAEISYSNLGSGRQKDASLERLKKRLDDLLLPPTKRLRSSVKGSLPGYQGNTHESKKDY